MIPEDGMRMRAEIASGIRRTASRGPARRRSGRLQIKAEAQATGRERAKELKVEHIIRDENGRIAERNSCGHDPRNVRG